MDPADVAERFATELAERYVYADTGSVIADAIRAQAAQLTPRVSPDEVAATLTAWAVEASNDRHIQLVYAPAEQPAPTAETGDEFEAAQRARARRDNYGVARIERLAGNVGLVELTSFFDVALAGEVIVAALNVVARTAALIVDLRRNGGGYPETMVLALSYLFDQGTVHLNDLYYREGDRTEQHWTLPYVPGRRFGSDKPVYVLISDYTFSAAEAFAYNLQSQQRATLVGERTGGGAHPGGRVRLDDDFTAFIPTGRAINPVTRTDWEGTGVVPDVPTTSAAAQREAHHLALRSLLSRHALDAELTAEAMAELG